MLNNRNPHRAGWGQRTQQSRVNAGQPYSTPIYVGSKVVGKVEDNTFYKSIHGSRHLLRRPPAIAFDISSILDAESVGATYAKVTDLDSGHSYHAPIKKIIEKGFNLNRGFGDQIALLLSEWRRDDEPKQLRLFGGIL